MQKNEILKKVFILAKKGTGFVSPNPLVGAVIVKNDKIIGEGYHQKFGEAHAEINAINNAIESVKGATLFCNLEPCCHINKKTPPCAQRIIKEGIHKVIISNLDPNPQVSGKGLQLLQNAGIEVETGILKNEGEYLNRFFFKYIKEKIPFVTVKIAQTLDGKIAEANNKQSWITSAKSIELVHRWRSEYDAVLIGAGTARIDDPQLTVRRVKGRDPLRIIVDGRLNISPDLKIINYNPENTILVTSSNADKQKVEKLQSIGIRFITLNQKSPRLELKDILTKLAEIGMTSVLVEGGSQIFTQFISEKCFDELKVFLAPKFFSGGLPAIQNSKLDILKLKLLDKEKVNDDILITYKSK